MTSPSLSHPLRKDFLARLGTQLPDQSQKVAIFGPVRPPVVIHPSASTMR